MQRDILLLTEMIDAAEQAHQVTAGITVGQLDTDRQRRDALQWNFTALGEAAGQLSAEVEDQFPRRALAAADPAEKPDSSRLLVHRPGSPPHHRCRATARVRSRSTTCPGQHHRKRLSASVRLLTR